MALTLEQEQAAFDAQLEGLLSLHGGEYVLFKDGHAVGFFATHSLAYSEGIKRFGVDEVFLVAPVRRSPPQVVSYAWIAGVMFG